VEEAKDRRQKAEGRKYCHEIPRCNVAAISDMMIIRKTVKIFVAMCIMPPFSRFTFTLDHPNANQGVPSAAGRILGRLI
jgi:hypothetical protein